jgi:hypothetical protein
MQVHGRSIETIEQSAEIAEVSSIDGARHGNQRARAFIRRCAGLGLVAMQSLGYRSLPVFPGPFPECQFDPLQNDVMDFAALLESGLPQGIVRGLG